MNALRQQSFENICRWPSLAINHRKPEFALAGIALFTLIERDAVTLEKTRNGFFGCIDARDRAVLH